LEEEYDRRSACGCPGARGVRHAGGAFTAGQVANGALQSCSTWWWLMKEAAGHEKDRLLASQMRTLSDALRR
jgi:hypothetical protein